MRTDELDYIPDPYYIQNMTVGLTGFGSFDWD
jgi:hypothetical protein